MYTEQENCLIYRHKLCLDRKRQRYERLMLRRHWEEDGVSLKRVGPLVHRGPVERIRGVIVPTMTRESHLSRHEGKCEGLSGMYQSADSIKEPFHWACTPLLTLSWVVRVDGNVPCQLLIIRLHWVTLSCFNYHWHLWFKSLIHALFGHQKEVMNEDHTGPRTSEIRPFIVLPLWSVHFIQITSSKIINHPWWKTKQNTKELIMSTASIQLC